jgi:hypothetical protein
MPRAVRTSLPPALLCLFLLAACSGRDGPPGWVHEEVVRDGVRTVRTLSGSVWDAPARLQEVLSIGPRGEDPAYLFGAIVSLAQREGKIFVLDQQVPTVRVFDESGEHLRDIGRDGQGPGEFVYPTSLAIHPVTGDLMVRDGQTGRINLFAPGSGLSSGAWRIPTGYTTDSPMVLTPEGGVWTMQLLDAGTGITDWIWGMVLFGPEGAAGDTLWPPRFDHRPAVVVASRENSSSRRSVPFSPDEHWAMSPTGAIVGGVSGDYRFEVRWSDGRRLGVKRDWDPVPVEREEADWYRLRVTLLLQRNYPGWAWNGPEVPARKPAYSALVPDRSGRVWVERPGPGVRLEGCDPSPRTADEILRAPCWRQTSTWEVFDLEGRFLGPVEVPEGVVIDQRSWIGEDEVLTVSEDVEGVPYVKRYRLVAGR